MTRLFPAHRRAERFDSLVEGARSDAVDGRTAGLLELVEAIRSLPEVQPRAEFVADLRERLMVAAETELVAAPAKERATVERLTVRPSRSRRERRIRVALGTVAVLGATTSMAVASQGALPGDALYPLKRAIENTQAGFSVGDDAKGEAILGNASGRLHEVDELTRKDEPDAALVTETLNTFSDQASQAGNLLLDDYEENGHQHSIEQLHQFNNDSLGMLGALETVVPESAHAALLNAAQTLFALDAAATQVCPDCGDPITEVPPQLLNGVTGALGDLTGSQAGGELPGAAQPGQGAPGGKGVKGEDPSGLNPPEVPIQIPSTATDPTDDLGDVLPSTGPASGGGGGHHGGGGGGHNGGGGGDGGQDEPVDLSPVTTTVEDVVTGVVDGVTQVLGGLTGQNP
jgi:hypothetical protein